jgi:hypothetical protein
MAGEDMDQRRNDFIRGAIASGSHGQYVRATDHGGEEIY